MLNVSVELETRGPLAQPRRYGREGSRGVHGDVDGAQVVQGVRTGYRMLSRATGRVVRRSP